MSVDHIEFLVEEQSMAEFLKVLLPRILVDVTFEVYPSRGKDDLLKKLPQRLQGYRRWLPQSWRIVVIVDRDNDECEDLKEQLEEMADAAGFATRAAVAGNGPYKLLNRLVIEELEAWYFGDWDAVRTAYPRVSPNTPKRAAYRDPDNISNTWESFERIMMGKGYFTEGLRKIEAAREIARHIEPQRNSSRSFQVFRDALFEMSAQ